MKNFLCLALLLGFVSLGFGQKVKETSALQSMVETERAFARMSEEQGIRPAFMAFIADDGILFRPIAVKGKQWMMEHPLPPSDKPPLLSWQPTFADIALVGDMGYTTGPWEYKADIHDAKPVAWGNFLTVWKLQPDRSWKFAIDLGISNPQPEQTSTPWQLRNDYRKPPGLARGKKSLRPLLARERQFSRDSAELGAQRAFDGYASSEVRLFRNGKQPFVGKAAALTALPPNSITWTWEPAFSDVSRSRDLGYSYGTYKLTKNQAGLKTNEIVENGNYFRIWKMEYDAVHGSAWKVVADLLDPLPEPKKN